ncbi:hypothetical protein DH2020_045844 [Rehmannia glutinosa]|uniref:Bifunctional inhibitor/plant lipid transfer protein/seed storage helical domain-containing protein n=1 Tax=Rehmannia glutinosa TaxID=99300 RepID=A0ABR0UCW1_REHGL
MNNGWELIEAGGPGGAPPSAAQCKEERRVGYSACRRTIFFGWRPTGKCCHRIRVTHTECVCPLITPGVASFINVKRSLRFIEKCGRKVPPRFKCGSKFP